MVTAQKLLEKEEDLVRNPFRLVERHFPSYVPATEKKSNATRRCVVCKKHGTGKKAGMNIYAVT